jgi:phosphoribosylformylglycinamidine synthase
MLEHDGMVYTVFMADWPQGRVDASSCAMLHTGQSYMKARIIVMPKKTVLDPQGKTVKHALESMNFRGIKDVRVGKFMEIELEGGTKAELQKKIDEACHKLLSNPVIEEYSFEIHE